MRGSAVELDDDPTLAPHAVHLESLDQHVRLREREASLVEELQEPQLEVAPRDPLARSTRTEHRADRPATGSPRMAGEEMLERERVPETQDLGLVQRAFELAGPQDAGQVEQGARDGRHGDAVGHGDLV